MKPDKCCGELPYMSKCDDPCSEDAWTTPEFIECLVCGRIVYGCDEDSIQDWNNGDNDE